MKLAPRQNITGLRRFSCRHYPPGDRVVVRESGWRDVHMYWTLGILIVDHNYTKDLRVQNDQ